MNSNKRYQNIELLAPAGSMETFQAVIHAGADAVYLGGGRFGARAYANNFTEEELLLAIDYAHIHGRKVYLTVNTLFKERELTEELYSYLLPYYEQGLDAVIIQDMGAFRLVREAFPGLSIHTSTQMTVTNRYGAMMMKELGADRVVTAREMSFAEIRDIKDHVDIEIESFVHGALCYCYSGQCLFSSMLGGRSGNRGRCAQPCRLSYEVMDEKKHPVKTGKKERDLYILSPKDLCTVSMIPELIENGVDSFKIEGRMKQPEYAAGVVSVYRKYIDYYINACLRTDEVTAKKDFKVTKEDIQHLYDFGNRSGFTDGYYKRHNGREMITLDKPSHTKGNEALWEEIKEQYVRSEKKEKINGILRLKKDCPAKLEVALNDIRTSVDGDVVQAALKQPLAEEKVAASIKKTGNTPYEFAELDIDMDDDIFLPVQALNVLRRNALERLSEALTAPMRRTEASHKTEMAAGETFGAEWQKETVSVKKERKTEKGSVTPYLSVSIENRSCITLLLDASYVDAIYLDSSCYTRENLFTALKEENSDVYAWIYVPGTNVDYPVLQHPTDDAYYLEHNMDGSKGLPGCIYTESVNTKDFTDPNTVLYGHNMKNGSMFASLHNFEDQQVFEENPYFYIYTEDKTYVYEIFAAYKYNAIHLIYNFDLDNPEIFQNYLDQIFEVRDMSANIRQDVTVNADNRIVTLSTCVSGEKNMRYLVQGVLLNE